VSESPYQAIKRSISEGIAGGVYVPGQLLPSEPALSRSFGVARMTVNRAMRELAAERLVRRVPGVGTFVAEPIAQSGLVEIRNIADEIAERGHRHRAEVFLLAAVVPAPAIGVVFGLPHGGELYNSAVLHYENDAPIQFEDRLVDPAVAPDYLRQDFSKITPNAYLMSVAPAQQVEHSVQAIMAPVSISQHLALEADEPCLVVDRRTWARDRLATVTRLYYPGSRFRLLGKFKV
jgi:GntR family transcriptional regulator, histidine utilization repressor